jgi:hypothetical protein
MTASDGRCGRAIAYLKARVDEDDASPIVQLGREDSPVLRALCDALLVSYVVDEGDRFTLINERELDAERRSPDELHAIGLRNLAGLVSVNGVDVRPHGSIFAVMAGGNFEASLVLVDDLWDHRFRKRVAGRYAVAIPARDVLAFGDADDPAVRAELRAVIDRVWPTADHKLSSRLFTRGAGAWTALDD